MATFLEATADFIAAHTDFVVDDTLMLGETLPGVQSVYIVEDDSEMPDIYSSIEYYSFSFWVKHNDASLGRQWADTIYQLLQTQENVYFDSDWYVFLSRATSQPKDMGRSNESEKIYQLPVEFTVAWRPVNP